MKKLNIPELSALLAEQTTRLGPDHPDTLATRHLLARRIAERQGHAQAIPLYEQLVIDRTRVLGETHRDTLSTRHNLALCLASTGQFEKAQEVFVEVIRLLQVTYGVADNDTLRSRQWYIYRVLVNLESPEVVKTEYQNLLKTISMESVARSLRRLEIREQYDDFLSEHEELTEDGDDLEDILRKNLEKPESKGPKSEKLDPYRPKLESYHAKRAAAELGGDSEVWQSAIANDARLICERVLGRVSDSVEAYLSSRFHVYRSPESTTPQFEVIRRLVAQGKGNTDRLATDIALAYVDFAYYCIHVTQNDDEDIGSKVDILRRELRKILGENLDTTSDAELEFEQKFRDIVGLESVKSELLGFIRVLIDNKRQRARGDEVDPPRLHLVLTGNPGTGKTVVARHYGRLLFKLGLFASEKVTEIDKSHIVGPFQGDPETLSKKVIEGSDPGVLFIDEAYSLNDPYSETKGPGQRALEVILKAMEDRRATLVVILAGYKKEMADLMTVNPGLPSRIGKTIEFPNYSLDELMEIAVRRASKLNLSLNDGAFDKLRSVLSGLISKPDFGNAREVETLLEEAQRNLLTRLASFDDLATTEERRRVVAADIPMREQPAPKRFGFVQ